MESHPQNREFRNNPENFHPCGSKEIIQTYTFYMGLVSKKTDFVACEQQTADQAEHTGSLISTFV